MDYENALFNAIEALRRYIYSLITKNDNISTGNALNKLSAKHNEKIMYVETRAKDYDFD